MSPHPIEREQQLDEKERLAMFAQTGRMTVDAMLAWRGIVDPAARTVLARFAEDAVAAVTDAASIGLTHDNAVRIIVLESLLFGIRIGKKGLV